MSSSHRHRTRKTGKIKPMFRLLLGRTYDDRHDWALEHVRKQRELFEGVNLMEKQVQAMLGTLSDREREILALRFGESR